MNKLSIRNLAFAAIIISSLGISSIATAQNNMMDNNYPTGRQHMMQDKSMNQIHNRMSTDNRHNGRHMSAEACINKQSHMQGRHMNAQNTQQHMMNNGAEQNHKMNGEMHRQNNMSGGQHMGNGPSNHQGYMNGNHMNGVQPEQNMRHNGAGRFGNRI